MIYKVIISKRALKEIEEAIGFYELYSADVAGNFISSFNTAKNSLEKSPFFKIQYNNVRTINLKKFPYLLFFKIKEDKGIVHILSCFHSKRSPRLKTARLNNSRQLSSEYYRCDLCLHCNETEVFFHFPILRDASLNSKDRQRGLGDHPPAKTEKTKSE